MLETIKYPEAFLSIMKWVVSLLVFLLLLVSVQAIYEEVLELPLQYPGDTGEVGFHFSKPDVVTQGVEFEILLIFEDGVAAETINIQIFKGEEELSGDIIIPTIFTQSRVGRLWTDSLEADSTYELRYTLSDGTIWSEEFSIRVNPKVVVDRLLQETIYNPNTITENQKEFLVGLLVDAGFDYTLGTFLEEETQANQQASVEKKVFVETVVYSDDSTTTQTVVVLDVRVEDVLSNLRIIETIPKDFASHVDNISFSQEPIVLEEDPVVMWHLEGVEEERLQYSIEGNVSLTGNTILLTSVVDEEERDEVAPSRDLWLPILLIPLIAMIIIFFSKFNPNKK